MSLESDCEYNSSSGDSERMFIVAEGASSCSSSPLLQSTGNVTVTTPDSESKGLQTVHSTPTKSKEAKRSCPDKDRTKVKGKDKDQVQIRVKRQKSDGIKTKLTIDNAGAPNMSNKNITMIFRPNLRQVTENGKPKSQENLTIKRRGTRESIGPTKTKKRRTRSYRNSLIKGTANGQPESRVLKKETDPVEQEIYLDAEIDRVLEEKAIKNNLTATNVKSIIRQVITNNMVQKMIMSTLKREKRMNLLLSGIANANKDGNSSEGDEDDDILDFEPKLTRAKTKELFENKNVPSLWPISPMKLLKVQPPSETQILITSHDLPEDSEGEDEEYIPTEKDLQVHSDDESMTSFTSDLGSPQRTEKRSYGSIECSLRNKSGKGLGLLLQSEIQTTSVNENGVFKTPAPPRQNEKQVDYAIGLRTRSRLPLNDTPLEDLEMQLIPPDITKGMYDFGKGESDNEDYLAFLKGFACTGRSTMTEGNEDEEEADPEYNAMEDEEDHHDKEEHRVDRAVKVTKKELSELVAELFDDFDDCHFSSGEEFDDISNLNLNQQQPFALPSTTCDPPVMAEIPEAEKVDQSPCASNLRAADSSPIEIESKTDATTSAADVRSELCIQKTEDNPCSVEALFPKGAFEVLIHQMSQHVQLLSQSYLFYVSTPEPSSQKIAQTTKSLITNLWNMSCARGPNSAYSVCNLKPAVDLFTNYPKKRSSSSPIKKKILEETYFNELSEHSLLKFPGWVAHTICGSNVFMHGSLLPTSFCQNESSHSQLLFFTHGEDALIAHGLSDLEDSKLNLRKKAAMIAGASLVIRTPAQVYSRIRNIRFQKHPSGTASAMTSSPLQYYFQNKKLEPTHHVPRADYSFLLAPCQQPTLNIPAVWLEVVEKLDASRNVLLRPTIISTSPKAYTVKSRTRTKISRKLRPTRTMSSDSTVRTKSLLPMSIVKPMLSITSKYNKSKPSTKVTSKAWKEIDYVTRSFPKHFQCLSKIEKNSTALPVCNYTGDPVVYVIIPKTMGTVTEGNECKENVIIEKSKEIPLSQRTDSNPIKKSPIGECLSSGTPLKPSSGVSHNDNAEEYEYDGHLESEIEDENEYNQDSESIGDDDNSEDSGPAKMVNLCSSSDEEIDAAETLNSGDEKQIQYNSEDRNQQGSNGSEKQDNDSAGGGEVCEFTGDLGGSAGDNGNDGGDDDKNRERKKQNIENSKSSGTSKKDEETDEEEDSKRNVFPTTNDNMSRAAGSANIFSTPGVGMIVSSELSVKKLKKSPIYSGKMGGKKASKYNTGSAQQLLLEDQRGEGDWSEFDGVGYTFTDGFLRRVQHRIENEARNPGLYNLVVQSICDFGERLSSGVGHPKDLYLRLEDLLKDYPDLVTQLAGFITPQDAVETGRFMDHQQSQNELHFTELLEKWTADCPQLKQRIMQKYATLREDENLTEERIATVMEQFFAQNPVMMEAFKAMFSSIYRPQSSSMDFEIIDLDMEEKQESIDDLNVEMVKLPEETSVPATHSCPCSCHSNTSSLPFSTRIKHCTKCSLKFYLIPSFITIKQFQDGKVFVHNGRIMKPVNIKFTTPEVAREIQGGSSCISCLKPMRARVSSLLNTSTSPAKSTPSEDQGIKISNSPVASSSSSNALQPSEGIKHWSREEDYLLLTVYQAEQNITAAIKRLIEQDLPLRSIDEIKARFMELTSILQEMTESENPHISSTEPL